MSPLCGSLFSCIHVEVGSCFGLCPHTADALKRFCHGSSCSFPFFLPLSYLFPPSHLIAFDKCPYWLYIIRCTEGSLRLYYSAHIPHLFSILRCQNTCVCEVQIGPVEQLPKSQVLLAKESPADWIAHGLRRHF